MITADKNDDHRKSIIAYRYWLNINRSCALRTAQSVDKVLSPLCGGRAFLVAKNKNGNQKTRFGISP